MYESLFFWTSVVINSVFYLGIGLIILYFIKRLNKISSEIKAQNGDQSTTTPFSSRLLPDWATVNDTDSPKVRRGKIVTRVLLAIVYGFISFIASFSLLFSIPPQSTNEPLGMTIFLVFMVIFWAFFSIVYVFIIAFAPRKNATFLSHHILMPYFVIPGSILVILLGSSVDNIMANLKGNTPAVIINEQTTENPASTDPVIPTNYTNDATPPADINLDRLTTEKQRADDARYKMFINRLLSEAEIHYTLARKYSGFCKSESTKQAVQEDLDTVSQFLCFDDTESYAISVQLTSGKYYCLDSEFNRNETSVKLTSTTCPR